MNKKANMIMIVVGIIIAVLALIILLNLIKGGDSSLMHLLHSIFGSKK